MASSARNWRENNKNSLLIAAARSIMGMYTDWGNLKVVSQGAWWDGRTQWLNGVPMEWARIGGVHFAVKAKIAVGQVEPGQLGVAAKFR